MRALASEADASLTNAMRNGQYEVHYIGVNWPHHIFVNKNFKVIGAN